MRIVLFGERIPFARTEPRLIILNKPVYILTTLSPPQQMRVALEFFPVFTCEVERNSSDTDRVLIGFERERDAVAFANEAAPNLGDDVPLITTAEVDEERVQTAASLLRLPLVLVADISGGTVTGMFEGFL